MLRGLACCLVAALGIAAGIPPAWTEASNENGRIAFTVTAAAPDIWSMRPTAATLST